ncbi:MAG TPA: anti-sigma factor [Gaiellaceae bacterium]|jgi:anti-sigma-K factor RskA|nr:anti-sigma factor [Gaiellaceae bacterium]
MERTGIHELSAAYALDALDDAERAEFEEHLVHCADCRDTVALFRETAASLAYDAEMPPPPPALRERILTQARRERPNVVPLRRRWAFPAAASVAAVAACAAIGLGIWAATLHNRLGERPEAVDIQGANGSLIVAPSGEATLLLRNVEPAPAGKTYEIWVIRGETAARAGTFAGGERVAVALTRDVPDGSVVAVTLERAGGVNKPTTAPLFRTGAV